MSPESVKGLYLSDEVRAKQVADYLSEQYPHITPEQALEHMRNMSPEVLRTKYDEIVRRKNTGM
jgi:hypothetical protein